MKQTWNRFLINVGQLLAHPRLWKFLLHPLTRYVVAWLVTLGTFSVMMYSVWTLFDMEERKDGNMGHTTIDFGGQYLMGRMLVKGHGRELYNRVYHRQVLMEDYPRDNEPPNTEKSDVENFMYWIMGEDPEEAKTTLGSFLTPLASGDGLGTAGLLAAGLQEWQPERVETIVAPRVGGPLYPPIHALLFYPLAQLPPQRAYRINQVVGMLLAFVAGLAVPLLSRGRIWWPVATLGIMMFPGFLASATLGQNAALTLTLLMWGWVLIARGRPGWGGLVWGFLAFKPVWAAAFFMVPFLTRRWRMCLTMPATGLTLALLTLPVVGVQSWKNWLIVGAEAVETYKADQNWIQCSRDLLSVPRRWLDFNLQSWEARRDTHYLTWIGWSILAPVLALTCLLGILRRDRAAATGPGAAFLLLGAWLGCFHFMYYDVLLTALPVFLLFTEPRRYLEPLLVAIIPLSGKRGDGELLLYYQPRLSRNLPSLLPVLPVRRGNICILNRMVPTLLVGLFFIQLWISDHWPPFLPYDTFCLMVLWLWCAGLWLRTPQPPRSTTAVEPPASDGARSDAGHAAQLVQLGADVGGAH